VIDPVLSYATFSAQCRRQSECRAVDAAGYLYVTVYTSSTNMPLAGAPFRWPGRIRSQVHANLSGLVYAAIVGGNMTTNPPASPWMQAAMRT
jgi:hypothetical protein